MRNKTIIFLSVLWIMGMTAGFAVETEQNPEEASKKHMQHMGAKKGGLAAKLGLSKEERAEMKEKMHETRKLMIQLKAKRDEAKAELEHLLDADEVDEKAVMAAAENLAQVSGDIIKARVQSKLNIISMLTPEQREKMKKLRKGMHNRRMKRMEKGSRAGHSKHKDLNQSPQCQEESDKQ